MVAIDVNPWIVGLLENEFREFAGLADHDGVPLVCDDARSYLTHTDERFALIQRRFAGTDALQRSDAEAHQTPGLGQVCAG